MFGAFIKEGRLSRQQVVRVFEFLSDDPDRLRVASKKKKGMCSSQQTEVQMEGMLVEVQTLKATEDADRKRVASSEDYKALCKRKGFTAPCVSEQCFEMVVQGSGKKNGKNKTVTVIAFSDASLIHDLFSRLLQLQSAPQRQSEPRHPQPESAEQLHRQGENPEELPGGTQSQAPQVHPEPEGANRGMQQQEEEEEKEEEEEGDLGRSVGGQGQREDRGAEGGNAESPEGPPQMAETMSHVVLQPESEAPPSVVAGGRSGEVPLPIRETTPVHERSAHFTEGAEPLDRSQSIGLCAVPPSASNEENGCAPAAPATEAASESPSPLIGGGKDEDENGAGGSESRSALRAQSIPVLGLKEEREEAKEGGDEKEKKREPSDEGLILLSKSHADFKGEPAAPEKTIAREEDEQKKKKEEEVQIDSEPEGVIEEWNQAADSEREEQTKALQIEGIGGEGQVDRGEGSLSESSDSSTDPEEQTKVATVSEKENPDKAITLPVKETSNVSQKGDGTLSEEFSLHKKTKQGQPEKGLGHFILALLLLFCILCVRRIGSGREPPSAQEAEYSRSTQPHPPPVPLTLDGGQGTCQHTNKAGPSFFSPSQSPLLHQFPSLPESLQWTLTSDQTVFSLHKRLRVETQKNEPDAADESFEASGEVQVPMSSLFEAASGTVKIVEGGEEQECWVSARAMPLPESRVVVQGCDSEYLGRFLPFGSSLWWRYSLGLVFNRLIPLWSFLGLRRRVPIEDARGRPSGSVHIRRGWFADTIEFEFTAVEASDYAETVVVEASRPKAFFLMQWVKSVLLGPFDRVLFSRQWSFNLSRSGQSSQQENAPSPRRQGVGHSRHSSDPTAGGDVDGEGHRAGSETGFEVQTIFLMASVLVAREEFLLSVSPWFFLLLYALLVVSAELVYRFTREVLRFPGEPVHLRKDGFVPLLLIGLPLLNWACFFSPVLSSYLIAPFLTLHIGVSLKKMYIETEEHHSLRYFLRWLVRFLLVIKKLLLACKDEKVNDEMLKDALVDLYNLTIGLLLGNRLNLDGKMVGAFCSEDDKTHRWCSRCGKTPVTGLSMCPPCQKAWDEGRLDGNVLFELVKDVDAGRVGLEDFERVGQKACGVFDGVFGPPERAIEGENQGGLGRLGL